MSAFPRRLRPARSTHASLLSPFSSGLASSATGTCFFKSIAGADMVDDGWMQEGGCGRDGSASWDDMTKARPLARSLGRLRCTISADRAGAPDRGAAASGDEVSRLLTMSGWTAETAGRRWTAQADRRMASSTGLAIHAADLADRSRASMSPVEGLPEDNTGYGTREYWCAFPPLAPFQPPTLTVFAPKGKTLREVRLIATADDPH